MNRPADLRGIVTVAGMVVVIVAVWTWIESRPIDTTAQTSSTTTTTTTAQPSTTTTSPEALTEAICSRSRQFVAEAGLIPSDAGPGSLANMALSYWQDLEELASETDKVEIAAVIAYYEAYLSTAEPFDFNAAQIILNGDKERFQQLVTRPAPGLTASRDLVSELCEIDVPDQPSMSTRGFEELEDRLTGSR